MDVDRYRLADRRPGTDVHLGARQHPARRPRDRVAANDASGPRRFPGRVHHRDLVPHHQPDLQDRQQAEHDQRQHERELDCGLPPLSGAGPVRADTRAVTGYPSTLPMTVSNSFVIA